MKMRYFPKNSDHGCDKVIGRIALDKGSCALVDVEVKVYTRAGENSAEGP